MQIGGGMHVFFGHLKGSLSGRTTPRDNFGPSTALSSSQAPDDPQKTKILLFLCSVLVLEYSWDGARRLGGVCGFGKPC